VHEYVGDVNLTLHRSPKLVKRDLPLSLLSIPLWKLTSCAEHQMRNWVVIIRDRLATQPASLQRNRPATRERIKDGRLIPVGSPDQFSSDAEDLASLSVPRIVCLPFHEAPTIKDFGGTRWATSLARLKLKVLLGPPGDEHQEPVAWSILHAVIRVIGIVISDGLPTTVVIAQLRRYLSAQQTVDRCNESLWAAGIVGVGHKRSEDYCA